jgi:hypothetical protein
VERVKNSGSGAFPEQVYYCQYQYWARTTSKTYGPLHGLQRLWDTKQVIGSHDRGPTVAVSKEVDTPRVLLVPGSTL